MTERKREPLGPDVLRRKAAIFDELTSVLEDRAHARRARRATTAASILGAVLLVLTATLARTSSPPPPAPAPIVEHVAPGDPFADPRITIVRAVADARPVESIDDDELIAELRAAGFRGGFARAEHHVFLVSR